MVTEHVTVAAEALARARWIDFDLDLSLHTVRGHIKAVMAELGARSQLAALVAAHRQGLIRIDSRH